MRGQIFQSLHLRRAREQLSGVERIVDVQRAAQIEPLGDLAQIRGREVAAEDVAHGRPNDVARDVVGAAQLSLVLELELAGDRRQRGVDVGHARHDDLLAREERAALGVRDDVFEQRDGQALADAGSLVDLRVLARLKGDLLDDFADELRDLDARAIASSAATLPAR